MDIQFKENLKQFYDTEAASRDSRERPDWKINIREDFLHRIQQEHKKTLLELGAGPGYDSRFFMDNGLTVVAVDLSGEMVKKCKEKSVDAHELDFYNLHSLHKTFDCIWAMNTLLHVPKADLDGVLQGIHAALNENGLFYMGVYGGANVETEFVKDEISLSPRFFSYYAEDSLKAALEKYFEILIFEQFEVGRNTATDIFQSVVMRKK